MNENNAIEAPETGTKPRPKWRVNRARIGVFAAVMGVIAAFLCLAIIAPPTVQAATIEEAVLAGAVSGGIAGGAIGSVVPGLGTGIGALIGIAGGAIAGCIGYIIGGWGDGDGSAAKLARYTAWDHRNQTAAKLELGKVNADNIGELAQRAIAYYERSAYYGAVQLYQEQEANGDPHIYDSDYVLDASYVADEMVGSVAGTYVVYNKIFRQLDNIGASYIGDYSKNSLVIGVDGSNYERSTSVSINYENQYFIRLVSFCNTPNNKFVWLNSTDTPIIWNLGTTTTSGTAVLTDSKGVTVWSEFITLPSQGGYVLDLPALDIESGRYNLALPQSGWIWTANAAEDYASSGVVAPGVAIYRKTDSGLVFQWGWAKLPADQGFAASGTWYFARDKVWMSSATYSDRIAGGYPYLRFCYPDGSNTRYADTISLKPVIESIWNVSRSWRQIEYAATLAGQTSYQVLLDNGGAGIDDGNVMFPPTYIMFPDYSQLRNMTAEELMVMYYAYLTQLNETFQRTNIMDPGSVNISTASFDLLIRGSVYHDGTLVVGPNTPFTLYTTLEDLTIRKGQDVALHSPAHIITWADGYASLTDYLAAHGNHAAPNITYMTVGAGWTIHIDEIMFERQLIDEADLEVDKLKTYTPPDLPDMTTPPTHGGNGLDLGGALILGAIIGGILAVIGLALDRSSLLVAGIIVAAVCAGAWYIDQHPIDLGLWSLAHVPENLKAWVEAH